MEYKNLDKASAFEALKNTEKKDIKSLLTAEKVKKSEIKPRQRKKPNVISDSDIET